MILSQAFLNILARLAIYKIHAKATSEVIQTMFIRPSIPFDVFIFGEVSKPVNEILKAIQADVVIYNFKKVYDRQSFYQSAVIFIDDKYMEYKLEHVSVLANRHPKNFKFLHVSEYPTTPKYAINIFNTQSYKVYFNHYVAFDANNLRIHFFKFTRFHETRCNKMIKETINSYDVRLQKWDENLTMKEPYMNFNRCLVSNFLPPKIFMFGEIFSMLAHVGNFTPHQQQFQIMRNITSKTITFLILPLDGKMITPFVRVEFFWLSTKQLTLLDYTSLYKTTKAVIAITPGEPYTIYEKLFLPFDELTWILLIMTFIITFIIIFIVNFMHKKVQDLIFGENVWTPTLNVVYIFFGLGQMKLPEKWFPRFILLMFIIFCLLFRTCYQSKLFEFMTSDMRKKSPRNISELKEQNFKLIVNNNLFTEVYLNTIGKEKYAPEYEFTENLEEFNLKYIRESFNYSAKLAFLMTRDWYEKINNNAKTLPIELVTTFGGIGLWGKNSVFHKILNELMEKIIPTGIPQFLESFHKWFYWDWARFKELEEESEPSVFSMDDLAFGFYIWLVTVGIAIIAFFVELYFWPLELRKRFQKLEKVERKIKFAKVVPVTFEPKLNYERYLSIPIGSEMYDKFKIRKLR